MKATEEIKKLNNNVTEKVKAHLPLKFQYLLGAYFFGLFFMLMYRLAAFVVHLSASFSDLSLWLLLRSLINGIWMDTIVSCSILLPFLLIFFLLTITNFSPKWIVRPLHILLIFIYFILFLVCALDAAYFNYFSSHINIIALSWLSEPQYLMNVFLRNPAYLLYGVVFFLSVAWYLWLMYCLYNATLFYTVKPYESKIPFFRGLWTGVLMIVLCLAGARGTLRKDGNLQIYSTYFCDNDFFNQLGVSPAYNLYKSIKEESNSSEKTLHLIDEPTARKITQMQFRDRNDNNFDYPVLAENTNIVLVVMKDIDSRSFTAKKMPNLYAMSRGGIYFDNIYADSRQAENGIYSSLFGYPTTGTKDAMGGAVIPKMEGLPYVLSKSMHYSTWFFTPHKQKQDNITRFLSRNEVHHILSSSAQPTQEYFNQMDMTPKPFFACIYLEAASAGKMDRHIAYLMSFVKKYPWFKNTMFAFVGANSADKVPLVFYQKGVIRPQVVSNLGMQADICPTLLAMRGKFYINNTMGMNLFSGQRKYAYRYQQGILSVADNDFRYINRQGKSQSLYFRGSDRQHVSYLKANAAKAKEMKEYGFAMIQTSQNNVLAMKAKRR